MRNDDKFNSIITKVSIESFECSDWQFFSIVRFSSFDVNDSEHLTTNGYLQADIHLKTSNS